MINDVLIIGAGAIGSYFIKELDGKVNLKILAKGERKARLESGGVIINGKKYQLEVVEPSAVGHTDLVIVSVKYYSLPEIIEDMKVFIEDETIILSTLNGVDSEELIAEGVGRGHILQGYMMIASQRKENCITISDTDIRGLYFGDISSEEMTDEVRAVNAFFQKTGLKAFYKKDVMLGKWKKWAFNISYNLPQAIVGVPIGSYGNSEHMEFLRKSLNDEVTRVAEAYGMTIGHIHNDSVEKNKNARYSTLQDIDAGRQTEIEMLAGVLIKKAAAKGIAVPCTEMIYHEIKALEEKSAGKFRW